MIPSERLAGLSVDIDSIAVHLRGYGIDDARDDDAHYRVAIPRMLELFAAADARATFFLITAEALRHPQVVRSIVAHGHEVGCHSWTHRLPFALSDPGSVEREIFEARSRLEELAEAPVVGFRAPSWGVTDELVSQLRKAGFRYDASSFPSWVLFALRWSISRRSASEMGRLRSSVRQGLFEPGVPHLVDHSSGRSMVEIPLCTTPFARLPYYHTLRFLLPDALFRAIGAAARWRPTPGYIFHAVDFLALDADGLDARIARHPGMDRPLEDKLALVRRSLCELARGRSVVPLREIADCMIGF